MHSLTILYMVYSTGMRTLDRWSLSVVLRKSSILKNVVAFRQYKSTTLYSFHQTFFEKKCVLTCKIIVIHNHSK